ncbi:LysM peptidoglycan-binding domain-containing protein [Raineyella sp.]|uniref:LysM peptidoglycan-binding domain-containing protein n=1 Tax=Raineyella sp. TaxID=1911550 RepID=UPI002B216F03|nr:LysM peptidoglycan-binding domain-containing protein [Raineyella sp.]MEA5153290.1 LysM peptidoglycan-binding domain-containing protein [Raineyella sp.]
MRTVRGLLALAVLLGSVLVVPWLLVSWGRYPAPAELGLEQLLLVPDDGRVLLWLLTGLGWLVWLLFTLSVAAEVVGAVGGRVVRLPGLRWMQLASGTLLLAVLMMLGTGQRDGPPGVSGGVEGPAPAVAVAYAAPTQPTGPALPAATEAAEHEATGLHEEQVGTGERAPARPETFEYRVQRGDDLWTLAETYLGDGLEWRRIRDLNPRLLRHDPDHLEAGWVLALPLPADAAGMGPREGVAPDSGSAESVPGGLPTASESAPASVESAPRTEPALQTGPAPVEAAPQTEPALQTDPAPVEATPQTGPAPAEAMIDPDRERSLALGGIGTLAATGIVAGLAGRRHLQLVQRPVGRVPQRPGEGAERLRNALLATDVPDEIEVVEWAVHMVARHALRTGRLAALDWLRVGDTDLEFAWDRHHDDGADDRWAAAAPAPFVDTGSSWVVPRAEVVADRAGSSGDELLRPWPTLVSLGTGEDDDTHLVDLERWGRLSVHADTAERAGEILTSYVLDLVTSSWAGAARVVVVGDDGGLVDTSGVEHVRHVDDLDDIITAWEATVATQQSLVAVADAPIAVLRLDPDFAEAWAPQVVVLLADITPAQRRRLGDRFTRTHRGPIVLVSEHPGGEATLLVDESPLRARFEPAGIDLTPQRVARRTRDEVVELHRNTSPEALVPAPWAGEPPGAMVTVTPTATPSFATLVTTAQTLVEEEPPMSDDPRLLLLGPIGLEGARGTPPSRAPRQCLEYCAWLLEHPNATSVEMARALLVAESTRRSNMSRLRGWLGTSADGRPYLPEAYSGRIRLDPAVRSDWQEVQVLLGRGIAQTSSATLAAILDLVRGAPLADAPPGDWTWAEELRIESACAIRDVADELAARALDEQDLDLAKWAIGRGLVAAPADELLLRRLLVAEHRSGNTREVERLVFTLNKQAHTLGIDLLPETVSLMQEVLEGGIRIRTAGPRRAAV